MCLICKNIPKHIFKLILQQNSYARFYPLHVVNIFKVFFCLIFYKKISDGWSVYSYMVDMNIFPHHWSKPWSCMLVPKDTMCIIWIVLNQSPSQNTELSHKFRFMHFSSSLLTSTFIKDKVLLRSPSDINGYLSVSASY